MINPLTKYQAWNLRREQRALERWKQIRAGGQLRFVINTSLTFGLTIVGVIDVADWLSSSGPDALSLGNLIYYVLTGIPLSLVGWSDREAQYQKASTKLGYPNYSSGELPPRDYPLRITSD